LQCSRDGILKVGDRILAVNGVSMLDYTLSQALKFLQDSSYSEISIIVEYDVSVLGWSLFSDPKVFV